MDNLAGPPRGKNSGRGTNHVPVASWLVALVMTASCGCNIVKLEYRTLVGEPVHYGPNFDFHKTKKQNHKLAVLAFERFEAEFPEQSFTHHFRDGFLDGFADYVTFGGDGSPPLLPPRRYWKLHNRQMEGQAHARQWFEGFDAGVRVAAQSGLRERQTVVSSILAAPPVWADETPFEYSLEPAIDGEGAFEEIETPEMRLPDVNTPDVNTPDMNTPDVNTPTQAKPQASEENGEPLPKPATDNTLKKLTDWLADPHGKRDVSSLGRLEGSDLPKRSSE